MKKIPWLDPILITLIDGSEADIPNNPLGFDRFLLQRLGDDAAFGSDFDALCVAIKLRKLILKFAAQAHTDLLLEDADHERLCRAIKTPCRGWSPAVAWAFEPFMLGVINAETVDVKSA